METKGMKKIFQSIGDLRPRQEELEYYFQSYPEVPKEVIIKSDCLRLGFQFTSQSLEVCQNYQTKSYHARSFDRARFDEMGRKENLRAPQELKIKVICPGKERFVGWDEWVRRLVEAVSVFGEGNVGSFFVAGVEMAQPYGFKDVDSAVRSTTEGMDYLMSQGIVPIPCPWCVDPLSPLPEHPLIPLEYYVRLFRNWYEIWKKYYLPKPPGVHSMGPGQATFSLSPYLDMGS